MRNNRNTVPTSGDRPKRTFLGRLAALGARVQEQADTRLERERALDEFTPQRAKELFPRRPEPTLEETRAELDGAWREQVSQLPAALVNQDAVRAQVADALAERERQLRERSEQ